MDAVDFNNLLDVVFGDRGKKTAQALAQKGGATDLSTLKTNAYNQLGIDEQVARQMETAAAQVGIFEESMNTLKATLGKPFLEGKVAIFKTFNGILAQTTTYFKEHPEVTKFMVAIAGGISGLLLVTGIMMSLVGVVGSLKLVFALTANPIGVVIMLIAALIGVVYLVVKHFKEFWEWVGKAWDKLKGFLGFKKDAKEELEDPINVTINENGEEQVIPVTQDTTQMNPIQQVQQTVQLNPTLQNTDVTQSIQQNIGTTQVPVELAPYFENSEINMEELMKGTGLEGLQQSCSKNRGRF